MNEFHRRMGRRIKLCRTTLEMSVTEFAKQVGMKSQYVYRLERGDFQTIDPERLVRIAEVLQTTPHALLGMEDLDLKAA